MYLYLNNIYYLLFVFKHKLCLKNIYYVFIFKEYLLFIIYLSLNIIYV